MELKIKDRVRLLVKSDGNNFNWKETAVGIIESFRYNYGEKEFAAVLFKNNDGEFNNRAEVVSIESNCSKLEKY